MSDKGKLSHEEKEIVEQYKAVYSIVRTIDALEWMYGRGLIQPKDYHCECQKLIDRFNIIKENIPGFDNVDNFLNVGLWLFVVLQHQGHGHCSQKTQRRQNRIQRKQGAADDSKSA
eukprot:TRINITY_DN13868_c0_g1_i8.p1 TRINITY_DN13868_c0_g1~~TRINITY_DN13868_c0_g1_i8.p1  ORF type:complete len:116 (+),score=17.69 TRINITY_DN13868_c0_g1_i8:162-509(+)